MVSIGRTDFYIDVPELSSEEFEEYSTKLFDEWEAYISEVLQLPDYSLALDVEEGSIKAIGKIAAALGVLYIGIGQYGSFISGLNIIHNQIRMVSDYFVDKAAKPFESKQAKPRIKKYGESLSRLKNLFVKVQDGKLTVEQAMQESEKMFGEEAISEPEFMKQLHDALKQTHIQMKLPFDLEITEDKELPPSKQSPRQSPIPIQPKLPPPQSKLLRVEVWRESKKSKKNVRVTKS